MFLKTSQDLSSVLIDDLWVVLLDRVTALDLSKISLLNASVFISLCQTYVGNIAVLCLTTAFFSSDFPSVGQDIFSRAFDDVSFYYFS